TVTTTADAVNGDTSSVASLIASDGGDGISLREAIIATNNTPGADEIFLPAGFYQLSIAGTNEIAALTGDLNVTDNLTIRGGSARTTVIDGGGLDRVFDLDANLTFVMRDVTVQDGDAGNRWGGGINISTGDNVTLERVIVAGNRADSGAGIYSQRATLSVTD